MSLWFRDDEAVTTAVSEQVRREAATSRRAESRGRHFPVGHSHVSPGGYGMVESFSHCALASSFLRPLTEMRAQRSSASAGRGRGMSLTHRKTAMQSGDTAQSRCSTQHARSRRP